MPITQLGPRAPAIIDAVRQLDRADKCTCGEVAFGWIGNTVAIQEVKTCVTEPKACMNEQRFSQTSQPLAVLYILISSDDGPCPWLFDRKSARTHLVAPFGQSTVHSNRFPLITQSACSTHETPANPKCSQPPDDCTFSAPQHGTSACYDFASPSPRVKSLRAGPIV